MVLFDNKSRKEFGSILPLAMTLERAITVLILTIMMCCISGTVALRKLAEADPADIY